MAWISISGVITLASLFNKGGYPKIEFLDGTEKNFLSPEEVDKFFENLSDKRKELMGPIRVNLDLFKKNHFRSTIAGHIQLIASLLSGILILYGFFTHKVSQLTLFRLRLLGLLVSFFTSILTVPSSYLNSWTVLLIVFFVILFDCPILFWIKSRTFQLGLFKTH